MQCDYYDRGACRSCTLIERPYPQQLRDKEQRVRAALAEVPGADGLEWLPARASAEAGFRNRAKMVVAGAPAAPTLGILDPRGRGVDLQGCPLYPEPISTALPQVAGFLAALRALPYDVPKGRGELKHVLVTASPEGELMLRFVLRSTRQLGRIREHVPDLQRAIPGLRVVSANLQPEHKAVLEGPEEIALSLEQELPLRVNGVPLRLRPRSFFQTNTDVAAALYRQARQWAEQESARRVLDLYCGVGGFGLHLAGADREVLGVEVSADAVEAAQGAAREMGLPERGPGSARFLAADATAVAEQVTGAGADALIVVNPPRRGLGERLCAQLEATGAQRVIYSSCHAGSLARDLARMPSWEPVQARVLDMFPHTAHQETAVLLRRRTGR